MSLPQESLGPEYDSKALYHQILLMFSPHLPLYLELDQLLNARPSYLLFHPPGIHFLLLLSFVLLLLLLLRLPSPPPSPSGESLTPPVSSLSATAAWLSPVPSPRPLDWSCLSPPLDFENHKSDVLIFYCCLQKTTTAA